MILWEYDDDPVPPRRLTVGERWLSAIAIGATWLLACLAIAGWVS